MVSLLSALYRLTPLLLDIIATIGLQVLVAGLYRSAEESSVQSSLPPTKISRIIVLLQTIVRLNSF